MNEYQNIDEAGVMHFPGFTVDSNNFLIEERNILAIGIDNLSVDPGIAAGFPAHLVTNGAGKYHLENVSNVHLLPESGAFIVVAPIKIGNGSGGQVRLFAIIPDA
jgi:kynurenine formamidase